jgi:hypothetical protein
MSLSIVKIRKKSPKEKMMRQKKALSLYKTALLMYEAENFFLEQGRKKKHIKSILKDSIASAPTLSKVHALLSHIYFFDNLTKAEESMLNALKYDSKNEDYISFLLQILLFQNKHEQTNQWLEKLTNYTGFDLSALKQELQDQNFTIDANTLVMNSFPNAMDRFESNLFDEVEKIGKKKNYTSIYFEQELKTQRCKKIDSKNIPHDFKNIILFAQEWGISDDAMRSIFIRKASATKKKRLFEALTLKVRRQINNWLDTYTDGVEMTNEAACFMYLLLAYEEMTN